MFTATSGAMLSVVGQDGAPPFCTSDLASVTPVTKDFMGTPEIVGPAPCTNSQEDYGISVPQHADATYSWSVLPITAGSVVAGAETATPTINWNNVNAATLVTLSVDIELCGQVLTLTENITLNIPTEPEIVQLGELCPSGSVDLEVDGSLFDSILWSTTEFSSSITVTAPGNYVVNTIDLNGCPGVDIFKVEEVDGPEVSLGLNGDNAICVNRPPYPANPVLSATTDPANTIEWFCNGDSQGAAATGNNNFTHVWNDTIKTYAYTVVVTDPNGCTNMPDPILIFQEPCCDTPYVTQPLAQNHTFTAINRMPDCDIVDLVATWSADSVDCHGWDLPRYTSILSSGGDETAANDSLTIRLPGVGCYKLESEIFRWAYDYDTTTVIDPVTGAPTQVVTIEDSIKCGSPILLTVCNPLSAEFDYSEDCGKVTFSDESEIDPTLVTGTVNYAWDFGDGMGTSTDQNPMYTYADNGTYTVTLVVSDDDCQSTFTDVVVVENLPDSDFTFSPNPVCYGKPVTFNGTGSNVIEWEWDFGNGATFVGNNPDQAFLPVGGSGTSTITLITTNDGGCMDTVTQVITINPNPDTVVISASNDLIICDGDSTTLSVPAVVGNTYLWSDGSTGTSLTVSAAGTYGVTITNPQGCETVINPVEVQLIPLPDASWFGNPFICDNGSTTLTAVAGGGHTYKWDNLTTGIVVTTRQYTVPFTFGFLEQEIVLTVTNDFGCEATSEITVKQVTSPTPTLAITGGECEGDGSTITVTNPQAGVEYTWSTGETGLSIFTYQAGAYTVLATDTETGCTGTATAIINPLPDLCLVPTGCYETCKPDTLYAPIGNYTYQWNDASGPIPGANNYFYIVEMAGVYTVKVTDNVTGCMATSDSLYLEIIDCDDPCTNVGTKLTPIVNSAGETECCYALTYAGLPSNVYAIRVSSGDAELAVSPGSVNPVFGYAANADPSTLEFAVDAVLSTPIPPSMTGPPVAIICPNAYLSSPQVILIEYLDQQGQVICEDILATDCEPEPDCVYILSDTLYCSEDGTLTFDFTICAPADQDYSIGYIDLVDASTQAEVDLPQGITLTPALMPGECRDLSITLSALTPGEEFCYTLVGHTANPDLDPTALCCSIQEESCLIIPDCDPCDDLGVVGVDPDEMGCCYDIVLFEEAENYEFSAIDICLIDGDATLSLFTSLGDPLTGTVNADGTIATITNPTGGVLPGGMLELPTICLDDANDGDYQIEIKWIDATGIRCQDTITVFCEPDCAYLEEELVSCEDDHYLWQGNIVNTSTFPMGEAHIQFPLASGLSAYDTTIVFGGAIPPGGVAFVGIEIGNPDGPGDT
ncbi:MAG: PKD domain-containing protein, partial [Bacteroidota bacterium]